MRPNRSAALVAILFALVGSGCASDGASAESAALVDGQPDAVGVLAFLNHESTTYELLDQAVRLDRRAAQGLVAHRDGPDGIHGTRDDRPFTTIGQVLEVYWVGPATLDRILAYASAQGWIPEGDDLLGVYQGVAFTVNDAESTLRLANSAPDAVLRHDVGLQTQAVNAILAARPIRAVLALSDLRNVGPVSLERLRAYALSVPPPLSCAAASDCPADERCHGADGRDGICRHDGELLGVYDGVAFTIGEADASLVLVNHGDEALLRAGVGLAARAVENVVLARPLGSVADLSAVSYVGPASLALVRDFARANPELIASLIETPSPSSCASSADCGEEACVAIMGYGPSRGYGVCRPRDGLVQENDQCTDEVPFCAEGLVCAGITKGWGWGHCYPEWMTASFDLPGFEVAAGATVTRELLVSGLASVPWDVVLTFTGPAHPQLVITLENLYETETPVWSHASSASLAGYHIVHPPGDEAVNGTWTLRVQNTGSESVTLGAWSVYMTSNWD